MTGVVTDRSGCLKRGLQLYHTLFKTNIIMWLRDRNLRNKQTINQIEILNRWFMSKYNTF
jgi:hypothetical protein